MIFPSHERTKKLKAHGITATVKSLQIICKKQNHFINIEQPVQPKGCVRGFFQSSVYSLSNPKFLALSGSIFGEKEMKVFTVILL